MMQEEAVVTRNQDAPFTSHQAAHSDDEIDLVRLWQVVWAHRKLIMKFALVPAALTIVIVFLIRPTYTAQASFLPPNSMSTGSSSAVLGQLGALGAASGALGALKDPSLIYVGILESRSVADELIQRFDLGQVYKTKKRSLAEKALRRHSEFASGKDSLIVVSVEDHDPKRAADLANGYLDALRKLNDRIALTEAGQKRLFFEAQLVKEKNALADAEVDLSKSQEKSGLIQPGGQARLQLETIAQTQAEISSREIQLAAMKQGATDQNPDTIRIRAEIVQLNAQLKRLEDSDRQKDPGNVQVPTSKVPELTLIYVRKAREVKYHEALYELLLRQYEAAKLDESRSSPLIQVVDYAVVPDMKSGPKRGLLTLLALLVGGLVGSIYVLVRYSLGTAASRI